MHMRKGLILFIILVLALTGCNLPLTSTANSTPIPISDFLINNKQKYKPTPTPFQPIQPTEITDLQNTPIPVETSDPSSKIDIGLPRPKGQVNILLLGSDWRPNMGYRTDVIMLVSINPIKGTVTVTSFPRDLYVEIPGSGYERINTTQAFGGFPLTQATFQNNFDAPIDYYMMTNFYGFKNIIDTLGGINVNAAFTLSDTCALPQAVNKYCTVYPGTTVMNGETALWYVRSRYSSSDFDRTRRAQEVILAIFQKLMSLNALNRSAELYDLFISSVETDIPLDIIIKLLPMTSQVLANPSIVKRFAIGEAETSNYVVPSSGAMVLIPDDEAIAKIIREAIYE